VAFATTTSSLPADADLSAGDRRDVLQTAARVKAAILQHDVSAIMSYISKSEGLTCTDTRYTLRQVSRYIHNSNSELYLGLFDTSQFTRQCGAGYPQNSPKAESDFFAHMADAETKITFESKEYAEVSFYSHLPGYYPRQYMFHREAGRWRLVSGFIIGSCGCG
jgi:hypothetical protein